MNSAFRMMVIEDSLTQAFKLRMLLEKQGWRVYIAGSAEVALSSLDAPLPDLILVDYYLPGMNGDEFCRRVRMNLTTRGIPILMMTNAAPAAAEIHSLDSGADDYASKSESPETLILRIRALLRNVSAEPAILNPQDSDFRPARILAIDDGPTYLAFLSGELTNQGYEVETASDGATGLDRLVVGQFDCVLVDLAMQGMDGFEVCRRIAGMSKAATNNAAVIILTGSSDQVDLHRGLESGADDFVSKSRDLAVLRARMQALMRRRFYQEESGRIVEEFKARDHAEERAMAEKLVQANHDLEEANRILEETRARLQLVAGIAHEIDNPRALDRVKELLLDLRTA
jgi:two-component system NtrC family sensor kinase